jgi:hypothetical protein
MRYRNIATPPQASCRLWRGRKVSATRWLANETGEVG